MANKFKAGDKVECVEIGGNYMTIGKVYTVLENASGGVIFNGDDGNQHFAYNERFKLADATTTTTSKFGFSVGDKVVVVDDRNCACKLGATAEVVGFDVKLVRVVWNRNELDGAQMNGSYYASMFAKVSERFIIALEENGKFAPAPKPKEYSSLKQAEFVAKEMAEKHEGTFYILKAVAVAKPEIVTTKTVTSNVKAL